MSALCKRRKIVFCQDFFFAPQSSSQVFMYTVCFDKCAVFLSAENLFTVACEMFSEDFR
jgi:hypothetical protein